MGTVRPFRFALQLTAAESGPAWAALAKKAEDDGYDVVSVPDHLDGQFEPLMALAAAAGATTTVRLGTFVLAIGWRRLGMLAKEVATLDVISGGRVEIGLGGGWNAAEFAALGLPFGTAGERIAQLAEAVPLLKALWQGAAVTHHGPHYDLEALQIYPQSTQPGGIPITLGGGGKVMLTLAGTWADIVSIVPSNAGRTNMVTLGGGLEWSSVRRQVDWVAAAAADRVAPPLLNLRIMAVTPGADRAGAAAQLAAERSTTPEAVIDSPFLLLGRPEDMVDQLVRARDELGITYFTVSGQHAAGFSDALRLARQR